MSSFAPLPVLRSHHFEIAENGRGYWVAKDREGLIGGVFRTQKDAFVSHCLKPAATVLVLGCFQLN